MGGGKFVTVYLDDTERGNAQILTDVEIINIGDRYMLVGTGADTGQEGNWTARVQVGIAWDTVRVYYAMTPQQFEETLRGRL